MRVNGENNEKFWNKMNMLSSTIEKLVQGEHPSIA